MALTTYRALLVANSTFPADRDRLPDLEGPRNDPALLLDALSDDRFGLFPSDNVRLVLERSMPEVLRELEELFRSATSTDCVLVYYSGHGLLDLSNDFYLCTRDTHSEYLRSTAVSAAIVSRMIDDSAAGTTVLMLDCCHAGAFKGGDVSERLAGSGRFVVSSCRTTELANDAHARNHASMFTHHVVEGLKGGAPDKDGDGLVSLDNLYDYVYAQLRASGRQVPQKRFAGTGEVAIALRPATSPATAVPEAATLAQLPPILDVAPTELDLGELAANEALPRERVAVINRGGGALHWTAESSDNWVTVQVEDKGVVLELHPRPGGNRANVFIRDTVTGDIKTVRVKVRVAAGEGTSGGAPPVIIADPPARPAPLKAASPEPALLSYEPALPTSPEPVPDHAEAAPKQQRPFPWHVAVGVASTLAGSVAFFSGLSFVNQIYDYSGGDDIFLRSEKTGTGMVDSIFLSLALALCGVLVLAWARGRRNMISSCLALAAALAALRAGDASRLGYFESAPFSFSFSAGSVTLALVACVTAALALRRRQRETAGQDRSVVDSRLWLFAGAALVWGFGRLLAIYELYDDPFGKTSADTTSWIVVGLVTAGLALAYLKLDRVSGFWLLAGLAVLPVVDLVGELLFLGYGDVDPTPSPMLGFWVTFLPVVIMVVTAWRMAVARRPIMA